MVEITRCKRCRAILTNPKSIELEYGKICYRVVQLQKKKEDDDMKIDINFLKCEINMLKRMIKQIKSTGINNIEDIERIRIDEQRPERDGNKGNLVLVVKELKTFFKESKLLKVGTYTNEDLGIEPFEIQTNETLLKGDFKNNLVKVGTYTNKDLGIEQYEIRTNENYMSISIEN